MKCSRLREILRLTKVIFTWEVISAHFECKCYTNMSRYQARSTSWHLFNFYLLSDSELRYSILSSLDQCSQLIESFLRCRKLWNWSTALLKPNTVVDTCDPSTWNVKAGLKVFLGQCYPQQSEGWVGGQLGLHDTLLQKEQSKLFP